jgi:rSAM/selenodomain-associated transferase 2
MPCTISIIIPALNEATTLPALLLFLNTVPDREQIAEIIVCDGNSSDETISIAGSFGVKIIQSEKKGRAIQMNLGASVASGNVLYFIHADTLPPSKFICDIQTAVDDGFEFGRYRTKFASRKPALLINTFITRFDLFICYGGDQTLFMTRNLFNSIRGFKSDMLIMEDYDIVSRAKAKARYKIIRKQVLISARKFDSNNWIKVQLANYAIVKMFRNGASQEAMVQKYKQLLRYR